MDGDAVTSPTGCWSLIKRFQLIVFTLFILIFRELVSWTRSGSGWETERCFRLINEMWLTGCLPASTPYVQCIGLGRRNYSYRLKQMDDKHCKIDRIVYFEEVNVTNYQLCLTLLHMELYLCAKYLNECFNLLLP